MPTPVSLFSAWGIKCRWLLLFLCCGTASLSAQPSIEWIGDAGSWTVPGNWAILPGPGDGTPTLSDDVLISMEQAYVDLEGEESNIAEGFFGSLTLTSGGLISVQGYASLQGGDVILGTNNQENTIQVLNAGSTASFTSLTVASGNGTQGFFDVTNGGSAGMTTLTIGAGGKGSVNVGGGSADSVLTPEIITLAGGESSLSVSPLGLLITESLSAASGEITIGNNAVMKVEQQGVFTLATQGGQSVTMAVTGGQLQISSTQGAVAVVGEAGTATLTASAGAEISTDGLVLGAHAHSSGSLVVENASVRSFGQILVGPEGQGSIQVFGGATLTAQAADNTPQSIVLGSSLAGSGGTIIIGGGPDLQPGTVQAAEIRGDGPTPGEVVFAHAGTSYTFAPELNGSLAIEVAGGTTIWTGDNAFSGSLHVAAGTLLINGSHTPSTAPVNSVAANAVLGGNGALNGNTTVHGIISPGQNGQSDQADLGTLQIAGDVTWNAGPGQAWRWDLGPDNQADLLAITGSLRKGSGELFVFDFSGVSHVGDFTLLTWTESNEIALSEFAAIGFGPGHLLGQFSFAGDSLVVTVVPEPSTWLLLSTVAGLLAWRRIRRRGQPASTST
jgi:autotransporter-associated beta strand protein